MLRAGTGDGSCGFPEVSFHGVEPWRNRPFESHERYVGVMFSGWERSSGPQIVYVASNSPMGYTERWWISANSGLLVAVETEKDGELVYAMSSRDVVSPLDQTEGVFVLPDGTELYRSEE